MLDLSEEPVAQYIETCKRYLKRMSRIGMALEIELDITGGEERMASINSMWIVHAFTLSQNRLPMLISSLAKSVIDLL